MGCSGRRCSSIGIRWGTTSASSKHAKDASTRRISNFAVTLLTNTAHALLLTECYTLDSMSSYSTGIPTSFDPGLLYSEYDHPRNAPHSISHSDELEALQACIVEDKAKKTEEGIVIQYRAWKLADIFQSEEDNGFGTACAKTRYHQY